VFTLDASEARLLLAEGERMGELDDYLRELLLRDQVALAEDEADDIRDLAMELMPLVGLDEEYASNANGIALERIIDRLWH
jgi:predicted MarR family transcription regulator